MTYKCDLTKKSELNNVVCNVNVGEFINEQFLIIDYIFSKTTCDSDTFCVLVVVVVFIKRDLLSWIQQGFQHLYFSYNPYCQQLHCTELCNKITLLSSWRCPPAYVTQHRELLPRRLLHKLNRLKPDCTACSSPFQKATDHTVLYFSLKNSGSVQGHVTFIIQIERLKKHSGKINY